MWFRNLQIYRLTQDLQIDAAALEQALASKPARPCESQELTTYGFAAPFGKGPNAPLVHASRGFLLISTRKQERLLPGSVVRDELAEKVEQIETDQMRKVFKKERDQLKDEIVQTLLPRAFIRKSSTFAALDLEQGLVLIDTHEDGGKVVATRQDMTSEEMQLHLSSGKLVTQVALAWSDKLSFVLDTKLAIKRLRFDDLLQEQAEKDGGDDAAGQLDASFVLMMLTFREFIPQLLEALGGEEFPQGIDGAYDEPEPAPGAGIDVTKALGMRDGITATLHIPQVNGPGDDPLLKEAIRFVRETRRASISAIQRKLKIGYNRAARLVEEMELLDIVGPMQGDGSREVLS